MADAQRDHGKTLLSWTIPEFEKHQRTALWYFLAVTIGLAMLLWAILTQNYLFAVIILIVSVILYRQTVREPVHIPFAITEDGIELGTERFYQYKELTNFWIVYEPPEVKKLFFSFRSGLRPELILPLEKQNPLAVRRALAQFLDEDLEKEGEPTSEALGRMLKL